MKLRPFQRDIVALMDNPIHITLFEKNRDVGLVISSGRYAMGYVKRSRSVHCFLIMTLVQAITKNRAKANSVH